MVSKKFGDLLVEVELEDSEMWREGTIRMRFDLGSAYETYHVSPPDIEKFRNNHSSPAFIEFIQPAGWIRDLLDDAIMIAIDALVWDLIEQKSTFNVWFSELSKAQIEEFSELYGFDLKDLMDSGSAHIRDADGQVIGGCEMQDPFYNPTNRLNPRHIYE